MFVILLPFILFLIFCGYSVLEGWKEGDFFDKWQPKDKSEEGGRHKMWTIQRSLVFISMLLASPGWWIVSLPFVFIFLHDGMYYHTRNKLNSKNYPKGWFDSSTTSTALSSKFETPIVRTISFVIGCLILISYYVLILIK